MENAATEVEAEAVHMRATVRVRPFSSREMQVTTQNVIAMSDNTVTITDPETNDSRQMVFDSCFWSHDGFVVNDAGEAVPDGPGSRYSGQEVIFKDIGVPALEKAWDGYNACVIAYGSTGSGKSLTMLGSSNSPGLVHLCCKHLFSEMSHNPQQNYKVTFSLCEIYNEKVVDLLSKTNAPLKIRTRPKMGPYVQDLAVMPVKSAGQTEELLQQGLKNRMIAATNMNSNSSRSHLIITLHFNQFMVTTDGRRVKRKSQLKFVDLAGSERATTSGTTGDRLQEGNMINRSLTGLGSVINALANAKNGKRTFVPYRETSLTRLLQEALGGNCATTLIATVSPASRNYDETLSTLRFAHRARKVSQKPVVNDVDVDKAIGTWKGKMDQMQTQMASAESEEEKINFEKSIEVCRSEMKKLELPWKEKDSKEKGGTWGSLVYNIHQPEFDTMPYLQNISEDAQLSGVVKHLIPQGHLLVGKSGTKKVSIELSGLGIQPWHAILVNTGSTLSIAPYSRRATVHVNGRPIHTTTTLNHLDHIKLGACEWFILVGFPSNRITGNPNAPKHMYEKCLTELAENHPLARELQPTGSVRVQTAALLLLQEFTDLLPKVAQAEALAAVFGKNMKFEVEIGKKRSNILFVRATDKDLDMEWVWSKAEFEQRRQTMDELYDQLLATDRMPALGHKNSPFYDSHQPDTCLGRCSVSLHNITYHLPVEDDVPVKDSGGKQVATVHISMMPCTSKGEPLLAQGDTLQDPTEVMDKELNLRLAVSSFRDVHWAASNRQRGIYCKVWMEGEEEVLRTETVLGAVNGKFHNKFHFAFDAVTTSLFKFFCTQGLQLELWGTQGAAGSSSSVPSDSSPQTSTDSVKNGKDGGLVLDLTLAQDLRHFFKSVGPVRHKLRTLKDHAIENSKAQEVRLQSWADCSSQLQAAEEELNNCVLSLKESVKTAIQRSKQS